MLYLFWKPLGVPPPPTQPLDVMLIHCRLPPAFYCIFITHLHSWAERGTVRIKCIAKQHNAINQPWCKPKRHHLQSSGLNVKGGKRSWKAILSPTLATVSTWKVYYLYFWNKTFLPTQIILIWFPTLHAKVFGGGREHLFKINSSWFNSFTL